MNFTVRVELHDATWDDYETLHAAMGQVGFSRSIKGDDGKMYQLPTAEYDANGNVDAAQVRVLASGAAEKMGKKFAVLVTTAGVRAWVGLKVAS